MKIIILEDEPVAARQLKKMLERVDGLDIESLTICSNAKEGRERIAEGLDLLFLDLNLMGMSGFDVLKEFLSEPFETIVTTAYPEHAVEAFELGVRDYLVKPFSQERLNKAIERTPGPTNSESPAMARIMVKGRDGIIPVPVGSIILIRSAGDYCELHLEDGSTHLCSKRMDFLENRLPEDFLRVHRSAIIRVSKLSNLKVEGGGRYSAKLDGAGEPVSIGRKYYKELKVRLDRD